MSGNAASFNGAKVTVHVTLRQLLDGLHDAIKDAVHISPTEIEKDDIKKLNSYVKEFERLLSGKKKK